MNASLKQMVNKKNYNAIRKQSVNISAKNRYKTIDYAVMRKVLSIATILDKVPSYQRKFTLYNSNIVKKYTHYFELYNDGDYTAIGNAAKIISFYLHSLLPKRNMIGNNLELFHGKTFKTIKKSDVSLKVLRQFKKIRQWPHLSLMLFPEQNNGSCHDYTLLRAMYMESQNQNYKLEVSTGTNTLLSHVNLRKTKSVVKKSMKITNFLLLTLFHTFRTHQTLKYITKSPKKMRKLENALLNIVYSCTQDLGYTYNVVQYILTRRHNSYTKLK